MHVQGLLRVTLPIVALLTLGGPAGAQSVTDNSVPRVKPQTFQAAPQVASRSTGGNAFSFDPFTNFFRARQRPLVDHRTYRELERNRFGGDTIDPTGRYDSFFTAPETRPTQRLGQYSRY